MYKKSSTKGRVLIDDHGTRFGQWTIRAKCTSSGIDVRAARLNPGTSMLSAESGDYQKDPLSGAAQDFNLERDQLFVDTKELCQAQFASGGSCPAGRKMYIQRCYYTATKLNCKDNPCVTVYGASPDTCANYCETDGPCLPSAATPSVAVCTDSVLPECPSDWRRYDRQPCALK